MTTVTPTIPVDMRELDFTPVFKYKTTTQFDINQMDPIAKVPIKSLVEEQVSTLFSYFLAVIMENHTFYFFDAISLRKWTLEDNTNPFTNENIEKIFYFVIQQPNEQTFQYLCSSENDDIDYLHEVFDPEENIENRLNSYGLLLSCLSKYPKLEFSCYVKASEIDNTDPVILRNLAITYDIGCGVEADQEKSFAYFKLSADNGGNESLKDVGTRYGKGKGVKKNLMFAIDYLNQAVKKNVEGAQEKLDQMIEEAKTEELGKVESKS